MQKRVSDLDILDGNDKSSWSDEELLKLSLMENHRITSDGYGLIWEHKIGDEWELHSVYKYRDYNYYMHLIHFHTPRWKDEYDRRVKSKNRQRMKELKSAKRIFKKIDEIKSFDHLKTKDKVLMISKLMPDESKEYIARVLGLSKQLVGYHLKNN